MSRIPGATNYQFSMLPSANAPRSQFDRSHTHKTTFNSGYLIPFYVDEVLPGDTFSADVQTFIRLNTPVFPIMDNLYFDTHIFFIPLRLVWDNFQRFMGERPNPEDSTDFLIPQVVAPAGGFGSESLADYYGIEPYVAGISVSALFFRAYNLVWNEWFRSQDLQSSLPVSKDDGPDDYADYSLMRRGKRHDYFTSCLPWPQKGPGVELPIGDRALVYGDVMAPVSPIVDPASNPVGLNLGPKFNTYGVGAGPNPTSGFTRSAPITMFGMATNPGAGSLNGDPTFLSGNDSMQDNHTLRWTDPALQVNLVGQQLGYADLSTATAATINSLRQAFQIQKLLERDARGGTRYTEVIQSHFGVISPDARLQRPEYLGGSSDIINITAVLQTSSTDNVSPQGNLAAYGQLYTHRRGFNKSFTEHGILLGLCSVRADLTYQQGIPRMFSRLTRNDHYWPAYAHLGEQAVLNKEIYAQGPSVIDPATNDLMDNSVFGYIPRFDEYRHFPNKITGKFRSTNPQPLDAWHLAQRFQELPRLNSQFIQESPPVARIVAVPDEPDFVMDCRVNLRCARSMPVFAVPGLVDHF